MQELSETGYELLKNGIKASNSFPSGENFEYYSCFSSFNDARKGQIVKILDMMQSIMSAAGIQDNIKQRNLEERFELLIDANDFFLDRANACMDEESGIKKNVSPKKVVISEVEINHNVNGSWNKSHKVSATLPITPKSQQTVRLLGGKFVERPQSYFKDKIDNSHKPWEPRIKYKHNLLKPLDIHLIEGEDGHYFNNPYEFELNKFEVPEEQLKSRAPKKYKPLKDTNMFMIQKPEDLAILLDDLRKHNEIAVDLEHHAYRTFQGITCLMQISTRETDYIIDTLTLRSELHELNEIFTNPKVLKVFHGADSDIQWLQRDLSIYVVNMFDTHQAAKQLALPYLSLAHLLKKYCNIDPNKHFQLADWRIRPLPQELIKYAREDTHYLLYIKDILKNELIKSANGQSNILKAVYNCSTEVCRITYKKPVWTEDSYLNMYRKSQKMFNNRQMYALKELHRWRDQTAREEDDSTNYVLPNHMMLQIAEALPKEMQGILALCNPIPPLVRSNLLIIHTIIRKAMQQPLVKPILVEERRTRLTKTNHHTCNTEVWNEMPHDFSGEVETRANLPCLLDNQLNIADNNSENDIGIKQKGHVTVFDCDSDSEDESSSSKVKTIFVSPYERYRRVIPMVAEFEAKVAEKILQEEEERVKKLTEENQDTEDRINRVHKHFIEVANQKNKETEQMPGCKRKRPSEDDEESIKEEMDNNLTVDDSCKPLQRKRMKIEKQNYSYIDDDADDNNDNNDDVQLIEPKKNEQEKKINSYRTAMKKGEKKKFKEEMKKKGLLPADKFNYKEIDFSSFQGGSKSSANKTIFQEQKKKMKSGKNKKKRQQKGLKI